MSYYSVKEDYIGDLSDLQPISNDTHSWEYYGYLAIALIIGIGIGVIGF